MACIAEIATVVRDAQVDAQVYPNIHATIQSSGPLATLTGLGLGLGRYLGCRRGRILGTGLGLGFPRNGLVKPRSFTQTKIMFMHRTVYSDTL